MRAKPWDVSDGLWGRIEPLLPRRKRRFRYPGRKPFDDRLALSVARNLLAPTRPRAEEFRAGALKRLSSLEGSAKRLPPEYLRLLPLSEHSTTTSR